MSGKSVTTLQGTQANIFSKEEASRAASQAERGQELGQSIGRYPETQTACAYTIWYGRVGVPFVQCLKSNKSYRGVDGWRIELV